MTFKGGFAKELLLCAVLSSLNYGIGFIMTSNFIIRPFFYCYFTHRDFESLMTDSHQIVSNFVKVNKNEDIYDILMETFANKLEEF